jgi:hypothetical protein
MPEYRHSHIVSAGYLRAWATDERLSVCRSRLLGPQTLVQRHAMHGSATSAFAWEQASVLSDSSLLLSTRRRSGRHGARVSKAVAPARFTRVIAVGAKRLPGRSRHRRLLWATKQACPCTPRRRHRSARPKAPDPFADRLRLRGAITDVARAFDLPQDWLKPRFRSAHRTLARRAQPEAAMSAGGGVTVAHSASGLCGLWGRSSGGRADSGRGGGG